MQNVSPEGSILRCAMESLPCTIKPKNWVKSSRGGGAVCNQTRKPHCRKETARCRSPATRIRKSFKQWSCVRLFVCRSWKLPSQST